ncbi:hypothetical protein CDIK_1872 [Cucumispora dikerogammari]|nr:hypothetical protein CDIK_1872 [Cucumispora dikerogammari]
MENKLTEFDKLRIQLKTQQENIKKILSSNIQEIINLFKIEKLTIDDIKTCAFVLINHRINIINNYIICYGEAWLENELNIKNEPDNLNDVSIIIEKHKIMKYGLELFLLNEILKQINDDNYFTKKQTQTVLLYSFKNSSIVEYNQDSGLNKLNSLNKIISKNVKDESLPVDILKISENLFPEFFVVPFDQIEFMQYLLIRDSCDFGKFPFFALYEFDEDFIKEGYDKIIIDNEL